MSSARLANQKKSIETFIDAWNRLSVNDIVQLRTPDCIQETLPKSLHMPDQTNDEWVEALTPAFGMLSNFKATIRAVVHDAEVGKSIVYANTAADALWGEYRNTHITIFTFNEDGTKTTKVEDMMDSAGMQARMKLIQAYQAKQTKQ